MKRGFLRKAFDKEKRLADERNDREPQPSSNPKDVTQVVQDLTTAMKQLPTSREDLPSKFHLPYGNLTDKEKALPEDYDKNNPTLLFKSVKTIPHTHDGDGSTKWIIGDENAERRVMSTPGFPARTPKPRRPDLYEVRTTPDMGLGVFAKHNIKRGEIIFSERPLLFSPSWLASVNLHGRYTPAQARQIMMFENEKVLEMGVQQMNENDKALYMSLHNSHTNDGSGPLLGISRTNGFGTSKLSDSTSALRYSGVCRIGSRLNHSCMPNVGPIFKISSFSYQFIALRDIKVGEELCCAYCSASRTKAERQTDLAPYEFSCTCPACINATPATDKLRKTFKDQVSPLDVKVNQLDQPELMAEGLASAKALESEMAAEGLDETLDFFNLLVVIYAGTFNLGRWAENMKYKQRIRDYCRIHVYDRPNLQEFSDGL